MFHGLEGGVKVFRVALLIENGFVFFTLDLRVGPVSAKIAFISVFGIRG